MNHATADASLINEDLAPTALAARTWNVWHVAALWVGMAVCIPTYTLASGLVDQGWTWQAAVTSVALGNLVVLIPMILNAHAGTAYGIPFPVLVRSSFGIRGANIPAMMRALVACGWFGINTYIGGAALAQMVRVVFMSNHSPEARLPLLGIEPLELVCFLAFWGLQLWILLRGIDTIKALESWSAPFLIFIGIALFVWAAMRVGSLSQMLENPASATADLNLILGKGLTTAVSFWGTLALNIPDFSRYAKSQRDQVVGQTIGLPATMAAFAFLGAVVTNATLIVFGERLADPVKLLGRIGGTAATVLALFALLIATLTTNIAANVVGPANDFSNLSPRRISFKTGCVITVMVGLLIMPWRLYNDAAQYLFTWLLGYGAMLGAVGGIMIADYYLLKDKRLDVDALYQRDGRYRYRNGFNPSALIALAAGIAINLPGFVAALTGAVVPSFFTSVYQWAWFVAFAVAAAVHLACSSLLGTAKAAKVS
jgi:nucleobase:cation symporter-1, NCS1 family